MLQNYYTLHTPSKPPSQQQKMEFEKKIEYASRLNFSEVITWTRLGTVLSERGARDISIKGNIGWEEVGEEIKLVDGGGSRQAV